MSLKVDLDNPDDLTDEELKWISQFDWMLKEAGLTQEEVASRLGTDEETDYSSKTAEELRGELISRDLSIDGKKAELIERLEADDAE